MGISTRMRLTALGAVIREYFEDLAAIGDIAIYGTWEEVKHAIARRTKLHPELQ
jgi:hypothetical protein